MEVLLLSIAISSLLFVIFKLFDLFQIHNFTAIVINYLVAYAVGASIEGHLIFPSAIHQSWFWAAMALGALFISLFTLMAKITQNQGIGISVLANKMSLILPVILAFIVLNESISAIQFSGILLALMGIYLTATRQEFDFSIQTFKWPLVLFIGSGMLDFGLKLNQQFLLNSEDYFAFVSTIFLSAFALGVIYGVVTKSFALNFKNILGGVGLGLPNYFSIYFLMMALNLKGLESTVVFPINNSGILLLSTLVGFLFFKEKLSLKNWMGISCCIVAILLISLSIS